MERLVLAVRDTLDLETLVVEDDLLGVGLAVDVERCGSADSLGVEIDIEVERDVVDARLKRTGEGRRVFRFGRIEDRRNLCCLLIFRRPAELFSDIWQPANKRAAAATAVRNNIMKGPYSAVLT